jgi:hypothetical protein
MRTVFASDFEWTNPLGSYAGDSEQGQEEIAKRNTSRAARGPVANSRAGAAGYPTPEEINALLERFRQYIHDLATRTDRTGDVRTMVQLREDREALQKRVEELEAEVACLWRNFGA